jgi:hypothetical protein
LGGNVSSSDATVAKAGIVTKGSTGVELRWHEPSKFKLLTKEQKVELAAWNKSNPKKDGNQKKRKADGTNAKQSKARNELMAAMVESQTAGLTDINAKIASMTVGPTEGPLVKFLLVVQLLLIRLSRSEWELLGVSGSERE